MSRILCVWELGDDLGHLGRFSPIINELLSRGHEIFFIVNNLSKIETFLWNRRVTFLQAPVWYTRPLKPLTTYCFADILLYKGYQSPATLRPLVTAWKNLFDLIAPDLIIFDHAPTALLASSGLSVPRIIFSNGFVTPPPGSPPISLRPWELVENERIEKIDAHVVSVINTVADDFNLQQVQYVSDLYSVEKVVIAGYKEIDFYCATRPDAIYVGSILSSDIQQKPYWNISSSQKVFAYVKFGYEQTLLILDALTKLGANVVCFCPGISPEASHKYQSAKMLISDSPFDLLAVFNEANVVVCHAGKGMVDACLYFGCPMILIPTQLEQINSAKILEEMRVATIVNHNDSYVVIEDKFNNFFNDPRYIENAKSFAFKHQNNIELSSIKAVCNVFETFL